MEIQLIKKITKIINNIPIKVSTKYKLNIIYNIYLTSVGFRPGTFIFDNLEGFKFFEKCKNKENFKDIDSVFENKEYVICVSNILKDLNSINNISFYVGALYDSSQQKDIIYVYNRNIYQYIQPYIQNIETISKEVLINQDIEYKNNEKHMYIAKLLGYPEFTNLQELYTIDNAISITFVINDINVNSYLKNNTYNIEVIGYSITKDNLIDEYDKLVLMNKYLEPLNQKANIVIYQGV
jgi:hypothetical protein